MWIVSTAMPTEEAARCLDQRFREGPDGIIGGLASRALTWIAVNEQLHVAASVLACRARLPFRGRARPTPTRLAYVAEQRRDGRTTLTFWVVHEGSGIRDGWHLPLVRSFLHAAVADITGCDPSAYLRRRTVAPAPRIDS